METPVRSKHNVRDTTCCETQCWRDHSSVDTAGGKRLPPGFEGRIKGSKETGGPSQHRRQSEAQLTAKRGQHRELVDQRAGLVFGSNERRFDERQATALHRSSI